MRIEIDIPEWADERAIHILAGIERVAYKLPWEDKWHVKTGRCSSCGRCCIKLECKYLDEEPGDNDRFRCSEGMMRPFSCCISKPKSIPQCTVEFREV